MIDLKAALMVDITALSEQAQVALLTDDFDNCNILLQIEIKLICVMLYLVFIQ